MAIFYFELKKNYFTLIFDQFFMLWQCDRFFCRTLQHVKLF